MIHLLWASLAIPIVVHLVHRRKAKRVLFSTLRFLQMVDQRVARRQRLKELLLLVVRLLLLSALIGALYRPMVRSATFKGADVPTAVAIVLDNTYSMRAAAHGTLRFDQAKKAAVAILEGLKGGDSACLALFDSQDEVRPAPTTALSTLHDRVGTMECGYGTAELAGALRRALQGLQESTNPRKELYIISDFQRLSWTAALTEVGEDLPADMPVFLVDVGGEIASNLALESAQFGLNVQVAGVASDLHCKLRNPGLRSARQEVALYLDGEKVDTQEVSLASGAEMTFTFSHVFDRTGEFKGEVRLGPDELDADNARYFTVTVHDKLPVLLVNGAPSTVPSLDETFFLELALEAPAAGGKTLSPIETKVVPADDFLKQRLDDYAGIVLANVSRVDDLRADRLRRYVLGGGGLILFLGDRVDAASYNTAFAATGEEALLPAMLGDVKGAADAGDDSAFLVSRVDGRHPVFRNIVEQIDLNAARVSRFFSVIMGDTGKGTAVLAELTQSGRQFERAPLLLERKAGAGTVILCTSTADLDWNNLAARPFFLPVLHQMVYYASRSGHRAENVPVGMQYALDLPPSGEAIPVGFYGPQGEGPAEPGQQGNAEQEPICVLTGELVGGAGRVVFTQTGRPGIYQAVYSVGGAEPAMRRTVLFAVNVEPRESDSGRIEPEEAARLLGTPGAKVVRDPERLALLVRRERTGLPLWDYLFAMAIILAVAESFVGNVMLKH